MPTYQLNIHVGDKGLETLAAAGQHVTIVKSAGAGTPVAWVSFFPMQSNTVTWTEVYSVYASGTKIQEGARIEMHSTRPAAGGNMYRLVGGKFDAGQPELPPTQYGVDNLDDHIKVDGVRMATCGLYQGAVLNGQPTSSPLNAVPVPYNDEAVFTPIERLQIFTSRTLDSGLVLTSVSSNALEVQFALANNQAVTYSELTNEFVLE